MSDHPALDRIVEWALGRDDPSSGIDSHLEACAACREARIWAEALAAAIATGPPGAAPEAVVERALAIPSEHPRSAMRRVGWSVARLVEHAFGRPQLAGVRGSATGRRCLYAIDGGHVDLEIATDPDDGERFRITGQVLLDEHGAPDDLIAVLSSEEAPLSGATGDESGTCVFRGVAPGQYRIAVISPSSGLGVGIGDVPVETGEP